jgi:fructose/tagatose bisphosphate aldolase
MYAELLRKTKTVHKTVQLGIWKFNAWTDLAVAQVSSIRRTLVEDSDAFDTRNIFTPSMKAISKVVKEGNGDVIL